MNPTTRAVTDLQAERTRRRDAGVCSECGLRVCPGHCRCGARYDVEPGPDCDVRRHNRNYNEAASFTFQRGA